MIDRARTTGSIPTPEQLEALRRLEGGLDAKHPPVFYDEVPGNAWHAFLSPLYAATFCDPAIPGTPEFASVEHYLLCGQAAWAGDAGTLARLRDLRNHTEYTEAADRRSTQAMWALLAEVWPDVAQSPVPLNACGTPINAPRACRQ